jgi:PPK2 family polyphosphate:nucleotide phosphotransferase
MKHLLKQLTVPPKSFEKSECKAALENIKDELFLLQSKFYADGRFALLIIIQGVDTSGKDGVIRHVFSAINPMGVQVKSFKKPSGAELEHDFLWRVYHHFPAKGMIGIFNRSYYEDILVPDVSKSLKNDDIHHRCLLINELEDHLVRNNTHILKFFLHISAEEQIERIAERKTDPHKKWKYDSADDVAPKEYKDYMKSYEMILGKCNKHPWHVIPADKRWYRNYKVAEIVLAHFKNMKLKYPES